MRYLAIILDAWEDVNSYFEQGWEYVDSEIVVEKGKVTFYFVLRKGKNKPTYVIINRNRK